MKRFSALLLLCAILLSATACSGTEKETIPTVDDTQDGTAPSASTAKAPAVSMTISGWA